MHKQDPIPPTVEWRDGRVRLIDQRALPGALEFLECATVAEVCDAITSLAVRGAPALGATGAYGVALAARTAHGSEEVRAAAKKLRETRPTAVNLARGVDRARAAWEEGGADAAAGSLMAGGDVDVVVVGADRVAANGDVANKIGTYPLAVLAHHHGVPFVVAAPTSTIDLACPTGADIPVERRPADEIVRIGGDQIAPAGVAVENRAFDVTPAALVTVIVTELGILRPPYEPALREAVEGACA